MAVFENRRQVGVSGLQLLVSSLQLAMPRYNPEQLSRAESLGRELSASTSFADDDEWHEYQERVAAALAKPLPARGDSQRRTVWGAIAKAHKKMIAQLDADRAALVASSASGSRAMSAATKKRKAEATTTGVEASMAIAVSSLPTNSATLAAPPPPQALLLPQQMLPSFPSSSTGAEYGASLGDAGPAESVEAPLQDQQVWLTAPVLITAHMCVETPPCWCAHAVRELSIVSGICRTHLPTEAMQTPCNVTATLSTKCKSIISRLWLAQRQACASRFVFECARSLRHTVICVIQLSVAVGIVIVRDHLIC